jgi:hypothetical protein
MSKLQKKPPVQNMKFLKLFLLLWVIFALLDPDPDPATQLYPDPIGTRIRNPAVKYGNFLTIFIQNGCFLQESLSLPYLFQKENVQIWRPTFWHFYSLATNTVNNSHPSG